MESVVWEADALTVRVAVSAFEQVDHAGARRASRPLDYASAARSASASAPSRRPLAVRRRPATRRWRADLPHEVRAAELRAVPRLQGWVVGPPAVLEHLANGGGGLVDGFWDGLTPVHPGGPFGGDLVAPDTE